MKIVTVIGARPQFIKAAAVSRVINHRKNIDEVILHTGQHFDKNMSAVFFRDLEIPKPQYNLGINTLNHGAMTGRMIEGIEGILQKEKPRGVLVYGDTNSTLAGSLAARKLHIPVAHVEAGMRSFNMNSPEEVNRILTDRISDLLFCSTTAAMQNLKAEGFDRFSCRYMKTGDVMYDTALYYSGKKIRSKSLIKDLPSGEFVLGTLHREENTNDLRVLKRLIKSLSTIHKEIPVLLPLHPRSKKIIERFNVQSSLIITEPVGYTDMLALLERCRLVITDSGGLQKEAYFFKKFCITLREETEWIELAEGGFNFIAGTDPQKIENAFNLALRKNFPKTTSLYGNGHAAEKIVTALQKYFA